MSLMGKLFLIPCCKTKANSLAWSCEAPVSDPLSDLVSPAVYSGVLSARMGVLSRIMESDKYRSGQYEKNCRIKRGPDFGQENKSGSYLPARKAYKGLLYSRAPALPSGVHKSTQIIILSALYGPVHPASYIQDYNLRMDDAPAYRVWKEEFRSFLHCYVRTNDIQEIHLLFGSSTRYLRVARAAVGPLLEKRVIRRAVQYHVIDGSSRVTPQTHGSLLKQFLERKRTDNLPENVRAMIL